MSESEEASPTELPADLPALRLDGVSDVEAESLLLGRIRMHVADILRGIAGSEPGFLDPQRSFRDLGLDSLGGVELHRRLTLSTAISVPVTVVFEYPSPAALTRHLLASLRGREPVADLVMPGAVIAAEPVAIVGMSCRYPGGIGSPEDLWQVVASERDVISHFPDDREWDLESIYDADPDSHGKTYANQGGFLPHAADFDPGFFGISPREAVSMDPQQRLLLEASWEVLERAAIDPATLRGTRTGVFVGAEPQEYGPRLHEAPEGTEGYLLTGNTTSVMSGRISYSLGLEGPAVTVDTACSSSLVAMHLAAQALQRGECSLALAGGVCVMAAPGIFVAFSRLRGLSPDGRCKSFSAAAGGTGWSEGVGMVVLERLSDAVRNGHPVLALVRGSAINSDGASNGLTAPNGLAQLAVIRQALANASLAPDEVDAVEAHGTGTSLGDPVEARALIAAYGQERGAERPLLLGSIKSNIGHTQAAAGIAGVIKMVMAMRHGVLPRSLHLEEPTPHVDWSSGAVSLLTGTVPWPEAGRARRAGVSSFGISGTNAHLILEQAPAGPVDSSGEPGGGASGSLLPWVISARSEAALADQAARLVSHLEASPGLRPADVGYSLGTTRSALDRRAVLLAREGEGFTRALTALARGQEAPGLIRGAAVPGNKVAFLFAGQGSQRVAMGRELYGEFAVFAAAFDQACAYLDRQLDRPLRDVICSESLLLDQTAYTQPALFAIEIALYRLVESWGLRPDFVAGHSIGELAAAHVAGVFSLDDACSLVAARGALMQELPGGGAMVAVQATADELMPMLVGRAAAVSLAAINGPSSAVLSGDEAAVLEIAAHWSDRGRKTRRLPVSHAFHSPHMDEVLDEFRWVAEAISYSAPSIPVVSNLTGALASAEELCSPHYWVRHARETVRFCDGIRWLRSYGVGTFLELGPDGVLSGMAHECLAEAGDEILVAPVLRPGRPETLQLMTAVAEAYSRGAGLDWAGFFAGSGARRVDLPTYAFQRQRYWLSQGMPGRAHDLGLRAPGHPLLGAIVTLAEDGRLVLTGRLSLEAQPWLGDHVVAGRVLVPGTVFVELAVRAGDEVGCAVVRELTLETPLILAERSVVSVQIGVGAADEAGGRSIAVYSRRAQASADEPWTRHASGLLTVADPTGGPDPAGDPGAADLVTWPPDGAAAVDVGDLYAGLAADGYGYGPAFCGLRAAWRRGEEVFAEVALPVGVDAGAFGVHPALLDAVLHASGLAGDGEPGEVWLPFAWTGVSLHAAGAAVLRARLARVASGGVSITAADAAGALVVSVGSLVSRPVAAGQLGAGQPGTDGLYAVEWVPVPAAGVAGGRWAVVGGDPLGLAGAGAEVGVYADLAGLVAAVAAGEPVPGVVLVCAGSGGGGLGAGGGAGVAE